MGWRPSQSPEGPVGAGLRTAKIWSNSCTDKDKLFHKGCPDLLSEGAHGSRARSRTQALILRGLCAILHAAKEALKRPLLLVVPATYPRRMIQLPYLHFGQPPRLSTSSCPA